MIRGIRAVTAVLLTLVLLLSMPLTALAEITDIEGHWAKAIIESTNQRGVLKGYPDGSFRPDAPMTQAEFFALVNRGFGFQEAVEAVSSSVPENAWYTVDYKIAGAQGYLELLAAGLIKPNTPISRQMAGAILGKVLKLDPDETAVKAYGDGGSFASWSKGLCGAVSKYGYMQGYKDGTFRPEANISRAEVAAILYRVLGSLYNTAGVYGNSQSITTVPGNVTITRSGVTLRNMAIEGNLYLTEGIGDGTVTLEGVTVKGAIIAGGGAGGVFLRDTSAGSIMISNSGSSRVYVAVQGSSTVGVVEVRSAAKLEELDLKGTGFSEVIVSAAGTADAVLSGNFDRVAVNGASSRVSILKGTTTLLEADGKEANIEIDKSVRIMTLNVNKPARITGNCYIGTANIYSSYVYIEASPVKAYIAAGLTEVYCTVLAFSAGGSSGGGGGGGGSSGGGSTTTYTVKSVDTIEAITVVNGTVKEAIGLPGTVRVILNDGRRKTMAVDWNNGTPKYEPGKAGSYRFMGVLTLPQNVKNPKGLTASVNVTIKEAEAPDEIKVTSVHTFSDINVPYGTGITVVQEVYLPEEAVVDLSDGTDISVPVVDWDGGTPAYDGNSKGVYTFIGMLEMPSEDVTNPEGLTAGVRILVGDPVVENEVITAVEALADISVAYGTDISEIDLPDTVGITLSNGDDTKTAGVIWDKSGYDSSTAETYTLYGTLKNLPSGVVNSNGLRASVAVIVAKVAVTSVDAIDNIYVPNGTLLEAVSLPATVNVALNNGNTVECNVTWDGGTPAYDANKAGTYAFSGTLSLPDDISETDLKASVNVIVADAIVIGVDAIADISVGNGTAIAEAGLPGTTGISLSNGLSGIADIDWDTTGYDANTAGTYTLYGSLVDLPAGVVNPSGLKAEVRVSVGNATVAGVAAIADISVDNGTAAGDIGLPLTAAVTLSNGTTKDLAVTWDEGTPVYDGYTAGIYVFSGALTVPAGIDSTDLKASVNVIVKKAVVTSVELIADINIANGTEITEIGLPATVGVTLNNGFTPEYAVTWDGGTPAYDGYKTGTYVFSGTLVTPAEVEVTSLMASVNATVADAIVTAVDPLPDINVENGTAISNVTLPATTGVSLSNGLTGTSGITWDTTGYDGYTAGTYTLYGTLKDLPAGVVNPDGLKACINIVVADAVIAGVNAMADINVVNGTALGGVGLPSMATVALNNGTTKDLGVAWDRGTPAYDGNTAGTYVFSGTLTVPTGVTATDLKASVKVMVDDAVIVGVTAIPDINVTNGTSFGDIGLPSIAKVALNNGTEMNIGVTWDGGTPIYDGNTAGSYMFSGTLTIPVGIAATDLKASVKVIVADAIVTGVDAIADVNVVNGTLIQDVPLPATVSISLNNSLIVTAGITWDTTGYDANTAGTYTLYGNLVNLPAGVVNPSGLKAEVRVTVGNATVASVAEIADISVDNGTAAGDIGLPLTATVTLGNGNTKEFAVTWDGGTPVYDRYKTGTYVFSGTLTTPSGVEATSLKAGVSVIVADAVITGVNAIADINVVNGTALGSVGLPTVATVTLNNGTTRDFAVTWDGGTPAYDSNTAGTYVFSGTLTVPTGIAATDLKAGINVIVAVAGPTGTYTISTINVFSEGMSITVSNLFDAKYFNVYRISNNALVNPKPVSIGAMVTTLNAVYNDISDLEIWVYSDSAGSNRIAVFTLTGDGTSGTLVLK